ncbi:glycerate kinase (plasmid) [Paracoccus versutus]|uniref:Hydroxypyruvate reductase n=1 Tax=Paracoccus versutus TaxID=34007 RepID=A0AAQ0HG51_PARVE|nr:glycerate kinase [Paracoccus versutus]KGJ12150.1 hydroxypyruvate reductase [Paracoccus versutus]REG44614.1 hydroxypyruvate reductase [Paracoccus versutus]WEJ80567.1 glycerate kinase [Paracoccus versutus]
MKAEDRDFLAGLFDAAVAAADPETALAAHLPDRPRGRTVVVGAGKGAAQLAAAFERLWDAPVEGVVVTRYGYGCDTRNIRVIEAAHPVPDQAGLAAAEALFQAVRGLSKDDLVVALVCGGGSALLPAPPEGLTLEDEIELNRILLASGAPISVMNAIRKQVSRIKGGRLALAAHPARVVSLVVSDVPGDDPAQVASGPTVPDAATREEARRMIETWRIALPPRLAEWFAGQDGLPPDPADPCFKGHEVRVVASARLSLEAAAARAAAAGVPAVILSDAIEGEARDVARVHAAIAREVATRSRPFARPVVILSGGETTVTLRGRGRGGRNSEFLLALALGIEGLPIAALAADTDGIDGSEDNAGAFADGGSMARLRALGLDPAAMLAGNDAWSAFAALGDLFVPGPTGTNVNDFRAILIR